MEEDEELKYTSKETVKFYASAILTTNCAASTDKLTLL